MGDINWGLLQPLNQMSPIRSAAPQANTGEAPVPQPGSQMAGAADMMNAATERQKVGLLKNADAREQQLQPGRLQEQALQNQGIGLLNQKSTIELQNSVRKQKAQQNADTAFHQSQKSGGTMEQNMDAFQGQLTPEDQMTFSTIRENHQELIRGNNVKAINDAAGISAQSMRMIDSIKQSKLSAQDQAKQIDSLIVSTNKQLDRIDPDHPKIKTENDLNLYSVATVGTLMNPRVQAQFNFEMNKIKMSAEAKADADIRVANEKPTDLSKAQNDVRQAQANLQQAQQSGDQKAIQQAQMELQQTQSEVRGQLNGKSISGQIAGSIGNTLSGMSPSGIVNGASNYINNMGSGPNTPQQQAPAQGPSPGGQALQVAPQPPVNQAPSQADIEFTAQKYGMTVDQVKAKLGIK